LIVVLDQDSGLDHLVTYSRVNVSVYTQNGRSGKNARTIHAIRTNVIRTLYETKYADLRKTIYAKRNTLNDIRTLKRTHNENISKPLLKYRDHIKFLTTLAIYVDRLNIRLSLIKFNDFFMR
jgi:hypothetical protein